MSGLASVFVMLGVLWLLQLGLTWRQAMRFQKQVSALRSPGVLVSIGMARSRFSKVYVALAVDADAVITDALTLGGRTVFATGTPEPGLMGLRLGPVAKGRLLQGVPELVARAATQAAGFIQGHRARKSLTPPSDAPVV